MDQEQVLDYQKKGFSQAQIEEIEQGISDGVDITVYAKKELLPQLMNQIRTGLTQGLDMSSYAVPEYDWFQLEEIREGLLLGLDVHKYDSYKISSFTMHQMRRGLEDGMDLTSYIDLDPEIIREIRHARKAGVDIDNYVSQGFEHKQLKIIAEALANGIDIYQYINQNLRAVAIEEIVTGLENNIEVEVYAKECYNWMQMRELRLGLEAKVDVSFYSSPLYNSYQMREIRLGLEQDLEVDQYCSLMYPASVMAQMREEIANAGTENASDGTVNAGEENKDGITISISPDDMTAFIRLNRAFFGKTTRKEMLRSLRVLGITQNIDPRMMDEILSGHHLDEVVQIATGKPPVDGEDGYYEYFFDTEKRRSPKILPDGSADFQNMNWYEMVKAGQTLAYYHAAGKGEEGHTVTGKKLHPKRGKELMALKGQGFTVQADRKTYVSDYDGKVTVEGNKLEVSQIMMVSCVNQSTGSVTFAGNVLISGDVSNGVSIIAGGDVIIDGFVENCTIRAGRDVILKKGVNGGEKGSITAGGSVEGKFFESVTVRAQKSITVNYCLHSKVYSEGTLTVLGGKGLILGGDIFAAADIKASNVGNSMGVRTVIRMGVSDLMKDAQTKVERDMVDLNNKLIILKKAQKDFQAKFSTEERNSMDVYNKIENAIFTIDKDMASLKNKKDSIMRQIMSTADAMLTVPGTLYDNVVIDIDGRKLMSTLSQNVTVKKIDNRIGIFKNT